MLNLKFNNIAENIIKNLTLEAKRLGVKIYFVGGLVRDALMGRESLDIDILVEGNAIDFIKSLSFNVQVKSFHKDFGTAKTTISGVDIDFASTRKEMYPYSGTLPEVIQIGCTIKDDLIRRDFSVNAIAVQLLGLGEYKIIDLFNGQEDIKNKTLRVLHDKSIIDDPTRILRGLDFKLRFDFEFDEYTKTLIENYLNNPDRANLSTDRVLLTLRKLFSSNERAHLAFRQFVEKKYYKILFGEERLNITDIEKAVEIFAPLNTGDVYFKYITENPPILPHFSGALEIYKYYKNFSTSELCVMWAKSKNENLLKYFKEYKDINIKTTGADLIQLGFNEGKIIGEILDNVLEYKLLNPSLLKNKDEEINYIKANFIL